METDEKLKIGIGTKEVEKLKPAKVSVVTIDISPPKDPEGKVIKGKGGKDLSDKVTLGCKHPEKDELIEISKVKIAKDDKIIESGLWFNLDEDNKLPKNSAISIMLRHYRIGCLEELNKMELETIADTGGYLCIKAY